MTHLRKRVLNFPSDLVSEQKQKRKRKDRDRQEEIFHLIFTHTEGSIQDLPKGWSTKNFILCPSTFLPECILGCLVTFRVLSWYREEFLNSKLGQDEIWSKFIRKRVKFSGKELAIFYAKVLQMDRLQFWICSLTCNENRKVLKLSLGIRLQNNLVAKKVS